MTKKEKKFIIDILKRYASKKAAEIELAEELKKGIVETPPKTLKKTPPIDVKLPLIKEKDLLANAPNDPDIIY